MTRTASQGTPTATSPLLLMNAQFAEFGLPVRLAVIASRREAAWLNSICAALGGTVDEYPAPPDPFAFDIIATTTRVRPALDMIAELMEEADLPHRPLLIIIDRAGSGQSADMILSPSFNSITKSIKSLVCLAANQRHPLGEAQPSQYHTPAPTLSLFEQMQTPAEVNMLINAFVRNLNHPLRTYVFQIKGAIEFISNGRMVEDNLALANSALQRLTAEAVKVSWLSQIIEAKLQPHVLMESINYAIFQSPTSELKQLAHRIRIQVEPNLPPVLADARTLPIAIEMFVDNALRFSDDEITVRAYTEGQSVIVSFEDSGIGIPADQLGKIFDAFYQVDSTNARRHNGVGIGLSIAKAIIDRHSSSIYVESTYGVGSRFWFSLPVVKFDESHRPLRQG